MDTPAPSSVPTDPPRPMARATDWRLWAAWGVALALSAAFRTRTLVLDAERAGLGFDLTWAATLEITSHVTLGAMMPAVYWVHRRWPLLPPSWRHAAVHAAATIPFCVVHVAVMMLARWLILGAWGGRPYPLDLGLDRFLYEYLKDVPTYAIFGGVIVLFDHLFGMTPAAFAPPAPAPTVPVPGPAPEVAPAPAPARPERFAVRRRGKEILVAVADIGWVEASGNYAILHVGAETYELRATLTRLETELDPARFVRVHKSYMVNIGRVREVEPWVNGDWRIRMDDGAEVSLSRRYRGRFEAIVPVRS